MMVVVCPCSGSKGTGTAVSFLINGGAPVALRHAAWQQGNIPCIPEKRTVAHWIHSSLLRLLQIQPKLQVRNQTLNLGCTVPLCVLPPLIS